MVNGQVIGNAQELSHIVGNALYSKFGLEGITKCDDAFAYGCYHGVSEKLLQEKGPDIVRDVQNSCLKIYPLAKSKNYTGCIHGMGHGLLTYENMNIAKALKDCGQLDTEYKNYCYEGVFMENSLETKQGFDLNKPWNFCSDLPEDYHSSCARYQSQFFSTSLTAISN